MAIEIKIPTVGESITEVVIAHWLKPEGSFVERDEPIVTLETDKVNVEIPAPEAGVLKNIRKKENETAQIGEVIAQIEAGAQKAANPKTAEEKKAAPAAAKTADAAAHNKAMPAAQRLMAEAHIDPKQVQATGPGERILKEDVQRAQKGATTGAVSHAPVAASSVGLEKIVPMTPLRRKVAQRLVQAQQTAAILTTFNEVDMSAVMRLRKSYQDAFVKKHGHKLGFMSFFVKAAIDALHAYPEVNAEIRGNDIVYRNYYDIGVAVGGAKGLVVPVVRRAELLSFADIEKTISDFGVRANAGKLTLDEMQGGTFTISNGGVYGSLMSTPILNPPQSGILGMHSIQERPVGIDGKIELRPMMYIALSYDHRIVDGRGAVSFLKRIKECIETPDRMLLEV